MLATDMELGAAGDQCLQPGTGHQELRDLRRGRLDMLEVVQHQKQLLIPEAMPQTLSERPVDVVP